jgi:hypothetical protein
MRQLREQQSPPTNSKANEFNEILRDHLTEMQKVKSDLAFKE